MEVREWLAKARLLDIGSALYISCMSSGEAYKAAGQFDMLIKKGGYENYSLVTYVKPSKEKKQWFVCIAKVERTDKGFIKKPDGEIVAEGNEWVTLEAQRIFKLAIADGKSLEEIEAMAVNDLEKRYVKELWGSKLGVIKYKELEVNK